MQKPLPKNHAHDDALDHIGNDRFLFFSIQDGVYGLDINSVKEILEYDDITRVPMASDVIRGVINLRGHVVPVIDLCRRLGFDKEPTTKKSCIIIIEVDHLGERTPLGTLVSSVKAIHEVPREDINESPSFGAKIRPDFIKGMINMDKDFAVVLDIKRVFSIKELNEAHGLATTGKLH